MFIPGLKKNLIYVAVLEDLGYDVIFIKGKEFLRHIAMRQVKQIELIRSCKEDLAREFEMKDMGLFHYFLGLEVWKGDGELFSSQGKYENEILKTFFMDNCKPMETPLASYQRKEGATTGEEVDATIYRQLVGSLMYLVNTQPDMCYAVNHLSQSMVRPTKLYWKASKLVLQYLRGTT
eukprot:PITA_06613